MSDAAVSTTAAPAPAAPSSPASNTKADFAAPVAKSDASAPAKAKSAPGRTAGGDAPSSQGDRIAKERADEKAAKAQPQEAEAKPTPEKRKYKLKVDGRDVEEEYDDESIVVQLQKARAAEKRFQEAANERARMSKLLELGKNDPDKAFKELFGLDARAHYEAQLAKQYQDEMARAQMKPEERVKAEYEAKLQAAQAETERFKNEIAAAKQAELDAKVYKEVTGNFEAALQSEGLPRSYEALAEMAKVAKIASQNKLDLTPQQLAGEVRRRLEAQQGKLHESVVNGLKGEALIKHLGPDVVMEVIRAKLAQQQVAAAPPPSAPVRKAPPPKQEVQERLSPTKFMKRFALGIDK